MKIYEMVQINTIRLIKEWFDAKSTARFTSIWLHENHEKASF